jgi:hypothetical protein
VDIVFTFEGGSRVSNKSIWLNRSTSFADMVDFVKKSIPGIVAGKKFEEKVAQEDAARRRDIFADKDVQAVLTENGIKSVDIVFAFDGGSHVSNKSIWLNRSTSFADMVDFVKKSIPGIVAGKKFEEKVAKEDQARRDSILGEIGTGTMTSQDQEKETWALDESLRKGIVHELIKNPDIQAMMKKYGVVASEIRIAGTERDGKNNDSDISYPFISMDPDLSMPEMIDFLKRSIPVFAEKSFDGRDHKVAGFVKRGPAQDLREQELFADPGVQSLMDQYKVSEKEIVVYWPGDGYSENNEITSKAIYLGIGFTKAEMVEYLKDFITVFVAYREKGQGQADCVNSIIWGDKAFKIKEYAKARFFYDRALKFMPGDKTALERLKKLDAVDKAESNAFAPVSNTQKGGIDLDPALFDMQIKRDGNGIPLQMDMQPIKDMKIEGFIPVIINITPVTNVRVLLGLETSTGDGASTGLSSVKNIQTLEQLAYVREDEFVGV